MDAERLVQSRQLIKLAESDFLPLSFADPHGRVFSWGNEIYRGIRGQRTEFYKALLEERTLEPLMDDGLLINTHVSDLRVEGYPLVLHHRSVSFISYAHEWTRLMLREAALMVLGLELALRTRGLQLQDAHPWNVLFDGPAPTWVDFGSIIPLDSSSAGWPLYEEFSRFFLRPLLLMSMGHSHVARALLLDWQEGVTCQDFEAVGGYNRANNFRRKIKSVLSTARRLSMVLPPTAKAHVRQKYASSRALIEGRTSDRHRAETILVNIQDKVRGLTFPEETSWKNYYDDAYPSWEPNQAWTQKHHSVFQALTDLKPPTVLDVGSNRGWYSQLAATLGSRVVALDIDEGSLDSLFLEVKRQRLDVQPLRMDIRHPTPHFGSMGLSGAVTRLRCDVVLALALVHHLVFKQLLNFQQIVGTLSPLATRALIVEFVPLDDHHVRSWQHKGFEWYTLSNFRRALEQTFKQVDVLPSTPEPRVLLVCRR